MAARLPQLLADLKARGLSHFVRGPNDEAALLDGYTIAPELGEHACNFMGKFLRHSTGDWAGKPFALLPWQRDRVVMPLFSWVKFDSDGRTLRRFRRCQIWVSVKNGKSELSAALCLTFWLAEDEPSFQGYLAANDREQASIVFGQMAEMVKASPMLSRRLTVLPSKKQIILNTNSFVRVLSSESSGAEGWNAQYVGIDEIHKFNEPGRELREALRNRGAARRQPMEVIISTAGDEEGVGHEEYQYAKRVQQGKPDGDADITLLPVIFEAPPNCDVADPEAHKAANPSYGHIIRPEEIAAEAKIAKNNPRMLASFRRYRLGIWTSSETPWLDVVKWRSYGATSDNPFPSDDELRKLPCCGGLDLSQTTDLTAWVLAWKRPDGTLIFKPHFWLPGDNIADREAEDRCDYRVWADAGWMTLCDGGEIDYLQVAERMGADYANYRIHQIGFDAHLANTLLPIMRERHGINDAHSEKVVGTQRGMVQIPQITPYMTIASKALEAAVNASGKVLHDGNPISARHVNNCQVYTDTNGNIKPVKCDKARRRMRIDFVAAAVNALSRLLVMRERRGGLTLTRIK